MKMTASRFYKGLFTATVALVISYAPLRYSQKRTWMCFSSYLIVKTLVDIKIKKIFRICFVKLLGVTFLACLNFSMFANSQTIVVASDPRKACLDMISELGWTPLVGNEANCSSYLGQWRLGSPEGLHTCLRSDSQGYSNGWICPYCALYDKGVSCDLLEWYVFRTSCPEGFIQEGNGCIKTPGLPPLPNVSDPSDCAFGEIFDAELGVCNSPPDDCRSPQRGNPVSVSTGSKVQSFIDMSNMPWHVSRTYRQTSRGVSWDFSFLETALPFLMDGKSYVAYKKNGAVKYYKYRGNSCWRFDGGFCSSIVFESEWIEIRDRSSRKRFDKSGRILSHEIYGDTRTSLTFTYQEETVNIHWIGGTLEVQLQGEKVMFIKNGGDITSYFYNDKGGIDRVVHVDGTVEYYRYRGDGTPLLIEHGFDGKAQSYWNYDDDDRVTRSLRAGEFNEEVFSYKDDEVSVTNSFGKETRYIFAQVDGVRVVERIYGEPSEHCSAASRLYEYYGNGALRSKTDWEGNLTTYERDDFGRETSRTEAAGTPEARTITTDYHPSLNKPVKITEPGKITTMTYDAEGRLTSKTTQSTTAH